MLKQWCCIEQNCTVKIVINILLIFQNIKKFNKHSFIFNKNCSIWLNCIWTDLWWKYLKKKLCFSSNENCFFLQFFFIFSYISCVINFAVESYIKKMWAPHWYKPPEFHRVGRIWKQTNWFIPKDLCVEFSSYVIYLLNFKCLYMYIIYLISYVCNLFISISVWSL